MAEADMPEWVASARTFIATRNVSFLTRAAEACSDAPVRTLLEQSRLKNGQPAVDDWCPLAYDLENAGRESEAAVVQLIGLRAVALAAGFPERQEPEERQFAADICNYAASLAQEHDFTECEALFVSTLGTRAGKRGERQEARTFLLRSLGLYRSLAETEPHIYRPDVALTLNHLCEVLREERDFPAARRAIVEAVETYRTLAETEPHIYRHEVAMSLSNLGTVLRNERELPAARRALEEAVETCRSLAETEPHIYRPDLAKTLNNLGNVLLGERDLPAARRAIEEAVKTYRSLVETEPRIYRPYLAGALNNLSNVLREEPDSPAARCALEEAVGTFRSLSEVEPHIYRPNLGMALSSLGSLLHDERDFPAARCALEEAVETYRSLAEAEPHIYLPKIAKTLNILGDVLSEEHDFPSARRAFKEAVEIFHSLAEADPNEYRPDVAMTLNNLGNALIQERDFTTARRALEEAAEVNRALARIEPHIYRRIVATTLSNLGSALYGERNFPAARRALEEALEINRSLARTEAHIDCPGVARTLNNLGLVLLAERRFTPARRAFEEAVDTYRSLAKIEPHIYRPDVAMTLNNLGNVLHCELDLPAARRAYEDALEIRRTLAESTPYVFQPYVAGTLNNLCNVLSDERDFPTARRAIEEAVDTYRSLAETEPHIYRPKLAMALNSFANVLEEMANHDLAWRVSRQAVDAAEDPNAKPDQIWIAKGYATAAYPRWLAQLISANDQQRCFRCLAAMREGMIRALGDEPVESQEAAAEALKEVASNLGQRVCFLIPQSLTDSRTVLGVLNPADSERLQCYLTDDFTDAARKLFAGIASVYAKNPERAIRREEVTQLSAVAWKALPKPVQELLSPEAEHDVLISGDSYWAAFPWEALHFGVGQDDWLGLHRTLARWGPLTAASIRQIARRAFGEDGESTTGDSSPTAAILCPWNASLNPKKHLLAALKEATDIESDLRAAGYKLLPDGRALLGQAAQPAAMDAVLGNTTSVIHYTGHGSVVGNEEVLVLHGGDVEHPAAYFGRQEIGILRQRMGRDKLLRHRPLVVLNSCLTGRTRNFGGEREDLASAFLAEGAEAVIASALPVYDTMGQLLGESLYSPFFESSKGMGQTLVEVRRLLERSTRSSRMWPTWTLLAYHGNPYARLPHVADAEAIRDQSRGSGFLDRIAKWLGLRDASEAAEFLRQVRDS